jgi:N-acetylglutamate synthase-like GNAT family acetyltransferase
MIIRKYKEKDKEQVRDLISNVLTELFGKTIIKKWENLSDYTIFIVAEDNNKLIGTIALKNMGESTGKLKRMYTIKEYRNRGIGQKMFDKVVKFAKKNNFKRIVLSTEKRLVAANNFYRKNGFKEIEVDWGRDFKDLKDENVDISRMLFFEKVLI